jgi:hypothetical protein
VEYQQRARDILTAIPSQEQIQEKEPIDRFLCLPCVSRKELYAQACRALPRTTRSLARHTSAWPFFDPSASRVNALTHTDIVRHAASSQTLYGEKRPLSPMLEHMMRAENNTEGQTPLEEESLLSRRDISSWLFEDALSSPLANSHSNRDSHGLTERNWGSTAFSFSSSSPTHKSDTMLEDSLRHEQVLAHSPVASQRLYELDSNERLYDSSMLPSDVLPLDFDREETASQLSLTSSLTMESKERGETFSQLSARSSVGSLTITRPLRNPREAQLLPFLLAKGLFREAERMLRIALGKRAVDEGDKIK